MTTSFEHASTAIHPWNIDRVGDPYSVYNSLSRASAVRPAPASAEIAPPQDSANLSGTSVLLAAAIAQTDSQTEARSERIAALRQSIEAGTYHVASEQVAVSILTSLL